ncbi:MAG: phosphoribosylanthranilate isomerase [Endomicrobia bacterium]|nr:phosphoribosylanthranilate isomerase [Endomicrobiia bacterium]
MTKIKICGITNKEDAFWASSLGADFVGLNFYKDSIRKVSLKNAKEIIDGLPSYTKGVLLFVDENLDQVLKIAKKLNVEYVQLHGNEDVDYCENIKLKNPSLNIIKVFKILQSNEIENQNLDLNSYMEKTYNNIKKYLNYVDFILFDTQVENLAGGTGETFSWDVVKKLKEFFTNDNISIKFFVAGGLTSENVEEVIELLEPYGVDVCSSVERLPRRKDFDKMKEFIRKVKNV